MKTFLFSCLLLTITANVFCQFKVTQTDSSHLPKLVKYNGYITNAVTWNDAVGKHYVLTTETGNYPSKTNDYENFRDAAIYGYHYILNGDSCKLVWRLYDFNKECPVDLEVYFIKNTFSITDLDKNGTPEIWLMYKNVCRGDVSPAPTKIIMYEGDKKHALRGSSKLKINATDFIGSGSYTLDDNFKTANPLIKQYAIALWNKHLIEKF